MIDGMGMYAYWFERCEKPEEMAWLAKNAGMSHMLVKIADGAVATTGPVSRLVKCLQDDGIQVVGWQYVYTGSQAEADIAVRLCMEYGIEAFVVNAEKQFKAPGMGAEATAYMRRLRSGLGDDRVIGLSSYRYPSLHPTFPFREFLTYCDLNMPQVYWMGETDDAAPIRNLNKSLKEIKALYATLGFSRPIVFTGAAFSEHGWVATPSQVLGFLREVARLALNESLVLCATNFWEWWQAHTETPELWQVIADYPWRYVTMSDMQTWTKAVTQALRSDGHQIPDPPMSVFPDPTPYQVQSSTTTVINLRDKPGGADIGDVPKGTVLTILPPTQKAPVKGVYYEWGQVIAPENLKGWVALENTTKV